ncbi:armadillo-type protein [Suillus ampliporus]|nr:armadillo-type protein [Suillus ampliporus]
MYWNDPASQERLSKLGPLWEKDIFDASTVGSLLRDIQLHGVECFDVVDRLAFMASFEQGRAAIRKSDSWEFQLTQLIRYSDDPKVRVSATVALSELLPDLAAEHLEKAAIDVLKMLESKDDIDRIRACKALPALVKHAALGSEILSENTFQRVLDLGGVSETESLMVQIHASQTLSLLARQDGYRPALTDKAANDITELLDSKHEEILVAALRILAALVHDKIAQDKMLGLIPVLIKHLKQHDFYVSPPVGNVICAYARHENFRKALLDPENGFFALLIDMLEHRLTDIEDPAIQILRQLASYADIQTDLIHKGHIKKLASLMKSRKHETSSGAILALLSILPHPFIRLVAVQEGVVETLVNHLKHQQKCLFAAYALSLILHYDNTRKAMFELSAPDYIVTALKQGSFNGTVENEHGKVVLKRLMHNDDLRAAVLQAHTIAALCTMFKKGELALNRAAMDFLDIMSNYPDGKELIKECKVTVFRAIVGALDRQDWGSQKNAAIALYTLFGIPHPSERTFVTEEFRSAILEGLPQILKLLAHDRSYRTVGGAAALLALSDDGAVRAFVREHADFKFVRSVYFSKSMKLQYHGSDPREEDVHTMLDKLFEAMEESDHPRRALKFPDVHPIPSRSPLVTSLAILSCVLYIPCGFAAMLTGLALDKTEPSPT